MDGNYLEVEQTGKKIKIPYRLHPARTPVRDCAVATKSTEAFERHKRDVGGGQAVRLAVGGQQSSVVRRGRSAWSGERKWGAAGASHAQHLLERAA